MPAHIACRICDAPLPEPFFDFGATPLANAFLSSPEEVAQEASYPLAVTNCERCGLVQLTYVVPPERMYRHYLYVSSTSQAVRRYATALAVRLVDRYHLGASDLVVELGSNDGLVLHAFKQHGVRVCGVEPASNLATLARTNGIPTLNEFFSARTGGLLARQEGRAAVMLGRHVFAHIDDWHDFFEGVSQVLAEDGVLLIEVPYLGHLVDSLEFDTIYHEHLSYLSVQAMMALCERHGFQMVDLEPVALHGGSILFSIRRQGSGQPSEAVERFWRQEQQTQLTQRSTLQQFAVRVTQWKHTFEDLIGRLVDSGSRFVGYGAAAKANTLLNFCPGVAERLQCVLDRNPYKHGLYTPGTHRPVVDVERWEGQGTSHMLILAWNFKEEIMAQMQAFARQGGRFVIPIPTPAVLSG